MFVVAFAADVVVSHAPLCFVPALRDERISEGQDTTVVVLSVETCCRVSRFRNFEILRFSPQGGGKNGCCTGSSFVPRGASAPCLAVLGFKYPEMANGSTTIYHRLDVENREFENRDKSSKRGLLSREAFGTETVHIVVLSNTTVDQKHNIMAFMSEGTSESSPNETHFAALDF